MPDDFSFHLFLAGHKSRVTSYCAFTRSGFHVVIQHLSPKIHHLKLSIPGFKPGAAHNRSILAEGEGDILNCGEGNRRSRERTQKMQ